MRARPATICRFINATILVALAAYFLVLPGLIILWSIRDPGLQNEAIPSFAFRWHRSLSPRYEQWAHQRVTKGDAAGMSTENISGTEWPIFGSVFYLWATESLQAAWQTDPSLSREAPAQYARGAIDAAAALVVDPGHADWVRQHWGDDYLHKENLFYRALLIAGMTSHAKLTGSDQYLPMLRDQVETLSEAIDKSPHGLVNDYPAQCYPTDVLGAIAAIRRADAVLGTDHSPFARRALRAFEGPLLDPVGLPPYAAEPDTGDRIGRSRGCGNSYVLIWLPELWPDVAPEWYARYEQHFWQHRWTAAGFREFPKDVANSEWYADVDAGPVLAGHGIAACAFGIGAARANGRLDHAYPLIAEMLITSCPLASGTLAGPRALSNATDAPYLGEAGVLFALTRRPAEGVRIQTGGRLPGFFYIGVALYLGIGLIVVIGTLRGLRRWRKNPPEVPLERFQATLWALLIVAGLISGFAWTWSFGGAMILAAQLLPRTRKPKVTKPEPAEAEEVSRTNPNN